MAKPASRARANWNGMSFARRIQLVGYAAFLIAAVELVVVSAIYDKLLGFWQGFLVNLGRGALAVAVMVLILNALQEHAQEERLKKQLIREMGSKNRDVAVPAVEEIAARRWLRDGSLAGANLAGANLPGAHLAGARLPGANLGGANLQGAHLAGARLQGAHLIIANLQGANLIRAHLSGADLQGAHLSLADLQGADLSGARLQGADLSLADVQGADLSGARLVGANLEGAVYDARTKWPSGFDAKAAGAVNEEEQAEAPVSTKEQ
jgi:Pentapeptide repeats (8 copies)